MQKIKIIIVTLILGFLTILSANASYYHGIDKEEKYEEQKYLTPEIKISNIKVKYEIGFRNEIGNNSLFYPIKLSTKDFKPLKNGFLEIYKEKFKYQYNNKIGQGEEFYKKIEIKNSNKLDTYFYKNENNGYEKYYFYLNINGERKKLKVNNNENNYYDNFLYISLGKVKNNFSVYKTPELFILKQFDKIYLEKDKISKEEFKILQNYIFSGGNLVLNKELLNNFSKNIKLEKKAYPKNCVDYGDCDNNGNEIFTGKDKYFYKYGFGKIYLENLEREKIRYSDGYYGDSDGIFLSESETKKILIDEVIKSKFVPFDVILYFTIIYFLSFIFINFILAKKNKNNKFFIFYSIPAGALFFLIVIISISFYYKGFQDIENKIQINHHLNNKILSQIFIANFSPNGGDYKLEIDKKNYIDNNLNRNYHFRENFSKKEIQFKNGKIKRKLLGVNSSSIQYFNYYEISDEFNLSIKGSNPLKKFNTKLELLNSIAKHNDKKLKNNIFNYKKSPKKKIEKIILSKKETEFMKKISFGGEKNKNYVIDVYYK